MNKDAQGHYKVGMPESNRKCGYKPRWRLSTPAGAPRRVGLVLSRNFRQLMRGEQFVERLTDQPAHRRVLVEGEAFQLLAHLGGGTSEALPSKSSIPSFSAIFAASSSGVFSLARKKITSSGNPLTGVSSKRT